MTTTDAKCKQSIDMYREVYLEGRKAYKAGKDIDDNPYPPRSGTKKGSHKRIAWFSGYLDQWREQREKYYEECRNNTSRSK